MAHHALTKHKKHNYQGDYKQKSSNFQPG